MIYFPKFCL